MKYKNNIESGNKSEKREGEPGIKYQLLWNNAAEDYRVKKWKEETLDFDGDGWITAGYRNQEGHYTEYGLYDSREELEKALRRPFYRRKAEIS